MPRPRAAECPPATQGRVCTTDAAAFGSKRALGAAVKNLQATSLSMDLAQRPRRDGASRERSECRETSSRWGCYACDLNLDDGASRVFGFFGSRTALVGVAGRRAVLPAGISGRVRRELRFLGRPRLGTTSRAQSILCPLRVFSSTVTAGEPGELSSLPSAPGLRVARAEKSGSASKACALNIKERFLDAARRRYKFGHTTTRKPCI